MNPRELLSGGTRRDTKNFSSEYRSNRNHLRRLLIEAFEERRVLTSGVPLQLFDSEVVPNLPAGWTNIDLLADSTAWVTSAGGAHTPPNFATIANPATASDNALLSPSFTPTALSPHVSFRQSYNTEPNFDGGVLELSINSGAFQDILAANGSFIAGGYNSTLNAGSALTGRQHFRHQQ